MGDHPVDDIQGASQLGMHTIWVNLGGEALPPGTPEPSDEVGRVHDIPTAVSRIAERGR